VFGFVAPMLQPVNGKISMSFGHSGAKQSNNGKISIYIVSFFPETHDSRILAGGFPVIVRDKSLI
jgi:hypothetical protein